VRIFLTIVGALCTLFGFACGTAGFAAYRSVDSDGYVEGHGRMTTPSAALITDTAELDSIDNEAAGRAGRAKLRIAAERSDGGPVFIGIANDDAVTNFIQAGSYATVRELQFGPFRYTSVVQGGTKPLPPPQTNLFAVSASGTGEQEIVWPVSAGRWRAVVMNADGNPGVDARVSFAVKFPYLRGFAIAGMVIGALFLLAGILLILFQARRRSAPPQAVPPPEVPAES
jgi:hypothetical protein